MCEGAITVVGDCGSEGWGEGGMEGAAGRGEKQLGARDKEGGEGCPAPSVGRCQADGQTDGWMGDKQSGKEGTGRCVYRDAGASEPVCPGPQRAPMGWEA